MSNAFPSRRFLVDYADGATLGEAYFRALPCAYWKNLVLGDVLAAPYASRPVVTVTSSSGELARLPARARLTVEPAGARLFIDGKETTPGDDGCVDLVPTNGVDTVHVLAVATADDERGTKGWTAFDARVRPGADDCAPLTPIDGVTACGCESTAPTSTASAVVAGACVAVLSSRFRSRRTRT